MNAIDKPTNPDSTPDKPGPRTRSPLPYGSIRKMVDDVIYKRITPGGQFTQNDVWDLLTEQDRQTVLKGYPTTKKAKKAVASSLNSAKEDKGRWGIPGLKQVAVHTQGRSIFVYMPPTGTQQPTDMHGVDSKVTFTLIGYTSDGKPLYRDDDTGRLGWVVWESL